MNEGIFPGSVLVTGAAGFIGRHVVDGLRMTSAGIRIVALDRNPRSSPSADWTVSCDILRENQDFIAGVILKYNVETLIHCAGSSKPDSHVLWRDNLETTLVLIELLAKIGEGVSFCHLGSSAEYKPLKRPQKTTEETPTEPVGEYGKIKLQTTQSVLKAAHQGDIQGYVLRLFNPIGIRMSPTTLVGRICALLRDASENHLRLGSLNSYRDYIDIRDVVRAIVASLPKANFLQGRILNIGTGSAQYTRHLVKGLLRYHNHPVIVEEIKSQGSSRSRNVYWQEADISLAKQLLGWHPEQNFQQTIEHIALNCTRPNQ
jgi:NDP-hexose 4-ketoreductase